MNRAHRIYARLRVLQRLLELSIAFSLRVDPIHHDAVQLSVTLFPRFYVSKEGVEARDEDLLLIIGAVIFEIVRIEEQPIMIRVHHNRGKAVATEHSIIGSY